jgi:hypothetical protein
MTAVGCCTYSTFYREVLDELVIGEHDSGAGAQFERAHSTILLCPFGESGNDLGKAIAMLRITCT